MRSTGVNGWSLLGAAALGACRTTVEEPGPGVGGAGASTGTGGSTATGGSGGLVPPTTHIMGVCPPEEEVAQAPAVPFEVLGMSSGQPVGHTNNMYGAAIADQETYDALVQLVHDVSLPPVDVNTHQVLAAGAQDTSSCSSSFPPTGYDVVETSGAPHLEARWSSYEQECCMTCAMVGQTLIVLQVGASTIPASVCVSLATGCGSYCEQ